MMSEWIPIESLAVLADVTLRVALLVMFTYAVTSCMRRSAALRHAVWVAAISLLFVVPWLPRAIPEITVASIPSLIGVGDRDASHARPLPLGLTTTYRRVDQPVPVATRAGGFRASTETAAPSPGAVALLSAWLLGAAVVLGRAGVHALRVRRITIAASDDSTAAHRAHRLARSAMLRLGWRRPVHIKWSREVPGPLTWGALDPVVILPACSERWSDGRLCAVLRHELAHVRRSDYLALWLGHVATAAFWWHPAVWLAVRTAARECERACDDAAVHRGLSMYEYAQHLVAIARDYGIGAFRPSAVGMADRRMLRDRVQRIIDPLTDRRPLTRRHLGMAWGLAAAVALPLVMVQMGPRQQPLSELIGQLEAEDVATRIRTAWQLGEREAQAAVPVLVAATGDPDPAMRALAVWALGEIKDVRGLDSLESALRDEDPLVREMAVLAVGELENARSVMALRVVLDKEPNLRPAVVWALQQIDNRSGGSAAARARAAYPSITPWDDGERARVDQAWLDRTPRSAETIPLLLRELQDPDPTVRRDAAWGLGRAGATEGVDQLIEALRDPDPRVRGVAIWALDEINPTRRR